MTAAKRPNLAKLRASVRAAALPASDVAGVELAALLAELLDRAGAPSLESIADGERPLSLEERLAVVKIIGPQYLRTLTALGLTKAGRGVSDSAGKPGGRPTGEAEHERHRQRFRDRA
jgi:hypothetical protein